MRSYMKIFMFMVFTITWIQVLGNRIENENLPDSNETEIYYYPYSSYETELRNYLLKSYDPAARPSRSTNVSFSPTIRHFDMNEDLQTLDLDVWTTMNWIDPRLTWDRTEFSGIQKLIFHKGEIWEPDLSIYNNADMTDVSLLGDTRIEVRNFGLVLSIPPAHIKAACVMDLTYWPYDTHNCTVRYGSWVYDGSAVNLYPVSDYPRFDLTELETEDKNLTRGEWRILEARLGRNVNKYDCCPEPYIDVVLSILVHRNAPAYFWTVQLPIMVLSIMTCLVYILPPSAPEKLIFGGICLMINFIMLEYCSSIIKHSPSHSPLLLELLGQQLKLTAGSVIISAIVIRIVRAPYLINMPNCCKRFLGMLSGLLCLGRYQPTIVRTSNGNGSILSRSTTMTADDVEMGDNGSTSLYIHEQSKTQRVSMPVSMDWVILGASIDRICFVLYIIFVAVFLSRYSSVL